MKKPQVQQAREIRPGVYLVVFIAFAFVMAFIMSSRKQPSASLPSSAPVVQPQPAKQIKPVKKVRHEQQLAQVYPVTAPAKAKPSVSPEAEAVLNQFGLSSTSVVPIATTASYRENNQ